MYKVSWDGKEKSQRMVNKENYMHMLYYELGNQQPLYFQAHTPNIILTKKREYLEIMHPLFEKQRDWFISNMNHRTPLFNEVFLDFDGDNAFIHYMDAVNRLMDIKEVVGFRAFENVNHIHVYVPMMLRMTPQRRQQFRLNIIDRFQAEKLKKSDLHMIALEFEKHWKRGVRKSLAQEKWR